MMPHKYRSLFKLIVLISMVIVTAPAFSADINESYPDAEIISSEQIDETAEAFLESSEDESSSIALLLGEAESAGVAKDVVVVLDNSGSMKNNDPGFLATQAVAEFISSLDAQTRIAIVIFDQNVSLAVPLTHLSIEARGTVVDSLKKVNYKGLFTDSPAAIERAIYELKNNGREYAQKSIVFMTDGIVDTGKADVDLEKSKWLKQDLAADAADESIKVFGIAFTEDADFQLIQSISQKTDGEYYRALQAADLQKVFKQINLIINKPPASVIPDKEPETVAPVETAPVVQQPVIIEVPVESSMGKEERVRSTIMIVAASVLFITLLAIVYLLLRRGREMKVASSDIETEAFINDPQNYTGSSQYKLGHKPTMFGRVAGKDTAHLNYLVIPESTIGRRHALIEYKDYGFWISDQGSINGTFVNDKMISSEVCLKHGDKIRLHKFEFEFVMPEMDDVGKTVMSNSVYAAGPDSADAATVVNKPGAEAEIDVSGLEPEFDITGGAELDFVLDMDDADESQNIAVDDDEDETLIRGEDKQSEPQQEKELEPDSESEDETLMPDSYAVVKKQESKPLADNAEEDDETLMRGNFDPEEDEDMTIRKESDESIDDFFDIDDKDAR